MRTSKIVNISGGHNQIIIQIHQLTRILRYVRSVFGSVPCSCCHVFYFEVSHGSRLCLASLSLMSSCYWFPCSLCHVLIGLF